LRRAFSSRTKAIILCSPNNPTGRVFNREELEYIASLCQEFDTLAITDEIYEHILYDGTEHIPIMTIPGMRDRTIPGEQHEQGLRGHRMARGLGAGEPRPDRLHPQGPRFSHVGAAAPLQQAGAVALALPDEYYTHLATDYAARRDAMLDVLNQAGFKCTVPAARITSSPIFPASVIPTICSSRGT